MNNTMDDLIPMFGIVFLFGAPVAAWIVSRVLAHNERMEMIRHGYVPPTDPRLFRQMNRAARFGWQPGRPMPPGPMSGQPGVPPPPFGANFGMPNAYDYYPQLQLRRGIRIACIGFALLIGLSFIGHGQPGVWMLGGLVPLFVGIAQIISAVLGGARFGEAPTAPSAATFSAPGQGFTDAGPTAPTYTAPAGPPGWRPDNTPEISKPPTPPDYR